VWGSQQIESIQIPQKSSGKIMEEIYERILIKMAMLVRWRSKELVNLQSTDMSFGLKWRKN
jgi:hypothetical protein